jgi:hypothetical protein
MRRQGFLPVLFLVSAALAGPGVPARAEYDAVFRDEPTDRPDGIHVLDGSYVLDMGRFHVNITNHGLIGSQYTLGLPYSRSSSGEWPGGSGHEYLWGAGLWVGAKISGEIGVTTGQPERELRPGDDLRDTIYEAKNARVTRPWPQDVATGWRLPDSRFNDDRDLAFDEDILNGLDDDGDGLIDEDFGQIGDQMFTCTMHDDLPLVRELYPSHFPLGVTVVQNAATWYREGFEDIVALEFEITNSGAHNLEDLYLGFYVDGDIQRRGFGSSAPDDLAGFWSGALRGSDGAFHRVEVAWMRDGDPFDPLPGWFGTVLLGHDTDFSTLRAPNKVSVSSYQVFSTNASVIQDGEPRSDEDRYWVMSRRGHDPDRRPDQAADLKYLISSGPFPTVPRGKKLTYQVAMVMGATKAEMLAAALTACEIAKGRWLNLDSNYQTGADSKETMVCLGDLPSDAQGQEQLFYYRSAFMDVSCVGTDPIFGVPYIFREDLFPTPDGRACIYVNADNCEECYRAMGQECTVENGLYWTFISSYPAYRYPQFFTGVGGREQHAPWISTGEIPPVPPSMRLVPRHHQVEIFWDDVSEHEPDYLRGVIDFESYRIWRVADWTRPPGTDPGTGPTADHWALIEEYDLQNFVPAGAGDSPHTLPLGRNTGLEPAAYVPVCLSDPTFAGLDQVMRDFVAADVTGQYVIRPPLRDSQGAVIPGRETLVPWEAWPTVLDTFFAVTPREAAPGVVGKRATGYYHHLDTEVHDGFLTYYSVVAADHALTYDQEEQSWIPVGYGIQSEPGNNYQVTTPAPVAQTPARRAAEGVNIYAFPNPATREALAEFQKQPPSHDDPTGERIMFTNLPQAGNTITIYTASGDLVQTLFHDGHHDGGSVAWNLMSRNGQEVVSGIYIYVVKADDSRFEDFQGYFTVIR